MMNSHHDDLGNQPEGPTREFTVATFVVQGEKVLLLWHRKLQRWLPPGGHIERDELPDDAAVREVVEETGVSVSLVGEPGLPIAAPRQLVRPAGVQLEDIGPGHQHVDLIYFARPSDPAQVRAKSNSESEAIDWFTLEAMVQRGVTAEVRAWAERALQTVGPAWSTSNRPSNR